MTEHADSFANITTITAQSLTADELLAMMEAIQDQQPRRLDVILMYRLQWEILKASLPKAPPGPCGPDPLTGIQILVADSPEHMRQLKARCNVLGQTYAVMDIDFA